MSLRPLCSRNSLKANEVVAKPPGTCTPTFERLDIISPNDAFLPPTRSTSFIPKSSYQSTYSCTTTSPLDIIKFKKAIYQKYAKNIFLNAFIYFCTNKWFISCHRHFTLLTLKLKYYLNIFTFHFRIIYRIKNAGSFLYFGRHSNNI